jgi:L-alanine-DL-glutamate epimerase-like enolase superfamily enzyme
MKMTIEKISLPYKTTFTITGYTFSAADTVRVTLTESSSVGRSEVRGIGESLGIYYKNETMDSIAAQLSGVADEVAAGINREALQDILPNGGARNALDCALWDLEAKRTGKSIWQLLNITPRPITTVYTLGIDTPKAMGEKARQAANFGNLKIKLSGDDPIAKLEAVRAARPDATLVVDINQGWSIGELKEYAPAAKKLGIAMIEQPLPRGDDAELEGFQSPIPLGADESCLDSDEYKRVAHLYDVINIKLDKCGGLTEGLKIIKMAQRDGKGLMVGNMGGSSLSMAPSFVIGQSCQFVDIDGPLLLVEDIDNGLDYGNGGIVSAPDSDLWG